MYCQLSSRGLEKFNECFQFVDGLLSVFVSNSEFSVLPHLVLCK